MKEIRKIIREVLNESITPKLLSQKIFTQPEMIPMGANYHLSHGMLMMIPVSEIDGLDPEPGGWTNDEGEYQDFEPGKKIEKPIEVIYDANNDKYMLYDGNHRVLQAKTNGDEYIKGFVQADREQYNKWKFDRPSKKNLTESSQEIDLETTALIKDSNTEYIILYNYKDDEILGVISLYNYNDVHTIGKSAALRGYGPYIYDFAMMNAYPLPLSPDREGNLSGEAYNIWDYYATKRKETVKKIPIPIDNEYYNEDEKELCDENKDRICAFNYFYYQKPNELYKKLENNWLKIMKRYDLEKLIIRADEFIEKML